MQSVIIVLVVVLVLEIKGTKTASWTTTSTSRSTNRMTNKISVPQPIFNPKKFLFRSDWTLAASGGAYMKIHYADGAASAAKIICQGTRCARTLTYTIMRISDIIGDPDSVL
jgi:hypothetical protein